MKLGGTNTGKRVQAKASFGKTALKIGAVALVLILVLLNLFTHVFMVVRYYGDGMEPTLSDRQILILLKTDDVKQGDITAFYYNNKVLVRRVICEGGRAVSIDEGGKVYINDELLKEPYVEQPSMGQCNIGFPYNVSVGQFFMMGDNRSVAMDSRLTEIGTIPADRIIGKVIFVI